MGVMGYIESTTRHFLGLWTPALPWGWGKVSRSSVERQKFPDVDRWEVCQENKERETNGPMTSGSLSPAGRGGARAAGRATWPQSRRTPWGEMGQHVS
jgi:hypothetical protein